MRTVEPKSERIATRVTPDQKAVIARAAAMRGVTVTEFMVETAHREARQVLEDEAIIRLSVENQERLLQALESPKPPTEALKRAVSRYKSANIISE